MFLTLLRPVARAFGGAAMLLGATLAAAAGAAGTTVPDTLAQRALACTGCHGAQGRAGNQGYLPRIAGKPAGYLFNQLVHFREGRRPNAAMAALVENLGDEMLRELAGHFAALELPYPPPAARAGEADVRGAVLVRDGDAARGLPACSACHGEALTGAQPALPGLLGLPRDYLVAQIGAWRAGTRRAAAPDCMAEVARRLSPRDIEAVAGWLAARPVPLPARAAERLPRPLPLACGAMPGAERR